MAGLCDRTNPDHTFLSRLVGSRYKLDFLADAAVKTQVNSRVVYVTLEIRLDVSVLIISDVLSNIRAVGYRFPAQLLQSPSFLDCRGRQALVVLRSR